MERENEGNGEGWETGKIKVTWKKEKKNARGEN